MDVEFVGVNQYFKIAGRYLEVRFPNLLDISALLPLISPPIDSITFGITNKVNAPT